MLHDPDHSQALDPVPGKTILRQTGPNASCAVWGGVGAAGKKRRRAPPLPIERGNTLRLFLDYRNLESLLLKQILRRDSFEFTWSFMSSEGRSVANAASAKQLKDLESMSRGY